MSAELEVTQELVNIAVRGYNLPISGGFGDRMRAALEAVSAHLTAQAEKRGQERNSVAYALANPNYSATATLLAKADRAMSDESCDAHRNQLEERIAQLSALTDDEIANAWTAFAFRPGMSGVTARKQFVNALRAMNVVAQAEQQAPEPIDGEFPDADTTPAFELTADEEAALNHLEHGSWMGPIAQIRSVVAALRRALTTLGPTEREKELERRLVKVNDRLEQAERELYLRLNEQEERAEKAEAELKEANDELATWRGEVESLRRCELSGGSCTYEHQLKELERERLEMHQAFLAELARADKAEAELAASAARIDALDAESRRLAAANERWNGMVNDARELAEEYRKRICELVPRAEKAEHELDELRKRTSEPEGDRLSAEERALIERVCDTTNRLDPTVGQLVNIIDRLAPKPAHAETLEQVIAEMEDAGHVQVADCVLRELEYWAGRLKAALRSKEGDRLAPKPEPANPLQELLAEMRYDVASGSEVHLSLYADKLEAALRAKESGK